MTWRRNWAKNWNDVKNFSDACRRTKPKPVNSPTGKSRRD